MINNKVIFKNNFPIIKLLIFIFVLLNTFFLFSNSIKAQEEKVKNKQQLIVFIRDGCHICHQEQKFLNNNKEIQNNFLVTYLNINDKENKIRWQKIVKKYNLAKVTPLTLVGGDIIVGFENKITPKKILHYIQKQTIISYNLENYFSQQSNVDNSNYTCQVDSTSSCSLTEDISENKQNKKKVKREDVMLLPFFKEINVKETSLLVMATVLGFIDGFNPCAMWVLITFLVILSQLGDKKKMIYMTGIFVLAEAIMYFFILNFWYQTWDFISLDQWVTPAVGLLALGAGLYFLFKFYKNKGELKCDVSSSKQQKNTVQKIKNIASRPITIITTLIILGIAFSVNIIEFACSVGIAQSFTKIIEINNLNLWERQWYIGVYTLFYMIDDFIIFALAIFGFQRFQAMGAKYSHWSLLLGGLLMLILGILMIFFPTVLVF